VAIHGGCAPPPGPLDRKGGGGCFRVVWVSRRSMPRPLVKTGSEAAVEAMQLASEQGG
jgi:hypothetical protein